MNVILLVLLIAMEVSFVVYSLIKMGDKRLWRKNRLIVNAIELVVYLLSTCFPGIDFSFRFTGLLILLIVRLLLAGLLALLTRKKETELKKVTIIASAIISVLLILMSMVPSFLFRDYNGGTQTGDYSVGQASAILTDENRIEEFESDGSKREVPVYFYYPKEVEEGTKCPLVIFSHGAFGYYQSNSSTYLELASHGYVVVSLDHPYHSFFCKDTSGNLITVDPEFYSDVMLVNEENISDKEIQAYSATWLKLRTDDISFVLDSFEDYVNQCDSWFVAKSEDRELIYKCLEKTDFDKIGIMGHSLGGAASVMLGRTREDVDAVIDLDGTMFSEILEVVDCEPYKYEDKVYTEREIINEEPYPVPILSIDNEEHHVVREASKEFGIAYPNNVVMDNALEGYSTYFAGSGHMNFTDLPLFSPVLANMLGTGSIDTQECIDDMNAIILGFFNHTLKDNPNFSIEKSY